MAEAADKGKGVVDEGGDPAVLEKNPFESVEDKNDSEPAEEKNDSVAVDIPNGKRSVGAAPRASQKAIPETTTTTTTDGKDYEDLDLVNFLETSELAQWSFWRAGIAEFIASFLFLYIGVQTVIGSAADGSSGVGTLGVAFAFGITIAVLVYCIAGISGGHINPAITFALLLVQRVSLVRFLLYAIAQVLGSLAGVGLIKAYQKGYYQRYGGAANFVHNGYSKGAGFTAELIGTFFLVYVVFTATDAKRRARDAHVAVLTPIAIGLTVFIVHLATIPITGTGINPARSFAAASYWDHHDHAWDDHWIFWVAPLLGATVAAMYHHSVIRAIPFRNLEWSTVRSGLTRRPSV